MVKILWWSNPNIFPNFVKILWQTQLVAAVKFLAHLLKQRIVDELIGLELLLEKLTDDSVEVAVGFVAKCGSLLQDLCPKGMNGVLERLRGILHEGDIDKRVQFLIEGLFVLRKAAKFQIMHPELDLVEQDDQFTHQPDPQFVENEKMYEDLKKQILPENEDDEDQIADSVDSDEEEEEDEEQIKDQTGTDLVNLWRTIYLTIKSSLDFEEAGHKLLKIGISGLEMELCVMLLECCSEQTTYLRYYGLLEQRLCLTNRIHQGNFEKCFADQYSMIHRLDTVKLRNVAKLFPHLLATDALQWRILDCIQLTEEEKTSLSRIFLKILLQELSDHLGIRLLNQRLSQDSFESIFPKDSPKNTRFAINFFTSIGLGGITENLREYLKNMQNEGKQKKRKINV
ncbi:hypothetical protein SASPL_156248 [Salvia splendens]|uniref:MI domain-containing protein n=1 Tax=Salvia splendens TaxID=180675 RepID=A0A8X8VWY0_SALSN|nr:hypothetical protein SASPL_156248 [Salvia splendens]